MGLSTRLRQVLLLNRLAWWSFVPAIIKTLFSLLFVIQDLRKYGCERTPIE